MNFYSVGMMLGVSMLTYVSLLHASMVVHLHDLYYEFYSHRCIHTFIANCHHFLQFPLSLIINTIELILLGHAVLREGDKI